MQLEHNNGLVESLLTHYARPYGCLKLALYVSFHKCSSMTVQISNNKAYQDYLDLKLNKRACKCATIENVTAILKHNNVEVNAQPSQPVSFTVF